MKNPYASAKDYQLWYKSVSNPAPGHIDPATNGRSLSPSDKIATMGSCFAQHLSKRIARDGFNYFVAETNNASNNAESLAIKNYGVFSARYGNVYTVRQAVQLFDRAFGRYRPDENIWVKDGRFYDAFRPQVEPGGFSSRAELLADRNHHLGCVRHMFENARWLIFTLGLTEAWMSKADGAILPTAPGVVAGSYEPEHYEFVNFTVEQVKDDLVRFVENVTSINRNIEFILTVSPVPLIATYENRHVLVSTTLSKSVLRVAADEVERKFAQVVYFPSYEIITSTANCARYFDDDLRQVNEIGVNHVMRVFTRHFLTGADGSLTKNPKPSSQLVAAGSDASDIVCDEEVIAKALQTAGFTT